jgi:hypothetical protein
MEARDRQQVSKWNIPSANFNCNIAVSQRCELLVHCQEFRVSPILRVGSNIMAKQQDTHLFQTQHQQLQTQQYHEIESTKVILGNASKR